MELHDYSFQLSQPLTAGRQVIRVENIGVEPHHLLVFKLAPGKSIEDYQAWMNQQQGIPPPGVMAELSTGREAFFEVDLSAGEYLQVCLAAGRDEVPHVAKGMVQHMRVE